MQNQEEIDAEREYLLRCLAKHLLKKTLLYRQMFLRKFEINNGEGSTDKIKKLLIEESKKLVEARNKAKEDLKKCLDIKED